MSCLHIAAMGLHLATVHAPHQMNDFNPGAYVRTDCHIQVGFYKNSEAKEWDHRWKWSPYIGYVYERKWWFVMGGIVGGYKFAPVVPLITAGIKLGPARLAVVPGKNIGFHLAVEWSL